MLIVISKTIELGAIGLIVSDTGRGKSMTLQAAADMNPGAILIRVLHSSRRPLGLATQIARTIGLRGVSTLSMLQLRIIDKLRGTGRPMLINEAHQLTPAALEFIRDLHDETGVPVVLVGTPKIADMIADENMFYGQLTSRIALRYSVIEDLLNGADGGPTLHSIAEIKRMFESGCVRLTTDGAAFLAKLANLPGVGGLRLCAKLVQVAAGFTADQAMDAALLRKVLRSMHGRAFAESQERAMEQSHVRVA